MAEAGVNHEVERDVEALTLTEWKHEPTVRDLKKDLQEAKEYHDSQVSQIDNWLDNMHVTGSAKVNTPEGSSRVQPKLIRKQAEWRYAALSEPFLSTKDLFDIKPVSWEDKKAAQQNKLVLNNQFNTVINKVKLFDEYARTAVDEGTVIFRVGWDFEEETYKEEAPKLEFVVDETTRQLHQELAELKAGDPGRYRTEVPEELQQAHDVAVESGQPVRPEVIGYVMVEKSRTTKNQPTVEICDYRNVFLDPTCKGDLSKAGFIVFSFESSLSELTKDGKYTNLDQINVTNNSTLSEPDHYSESAGNFNFADEARKKFVVYEYWGFRDIDGSGVVKPFVAAWVGNTKIRMEETPFPDKDLPFVLVPYLPKRRESYGEPDGALLEDNQKIAGAVTRGMIDLLGKSANGQTGMRKDMLDLTNKRKFERGQDYEFNGGVDPRQGVYTHAFPEIPASAQFMLQLQNMEAESLTGVKTYSDGVSSASLGDVAAGIRGALDAASKRELGILRRMSQGIVEVGRKIIAMNSAFLDEEEVVRVTNEEFVQVKRDDLAGNFDLELSISTAEEDNAKAQELSFMLQTVGPKAPPKITFKIMSDIARLRKMPELAKWLEDYEPEPDPMQQQIQQLEMQKLQAEIAEIQSRTQENYANARLDVAKAQTEQVKAGNVQSDTDLKNLNYVEQESGVTQERELQKHGEQARSQVKLKLLDHQFKQQEKREDRQFKALDKYKSDNK